MTQTNMARKLTVKELGINAKEVAQSLSKDGESKLVAHIVGTADGYKVSANKFDPTKDDVKFIGEFEGHNAVTGDITVSRYAYLPGGADEMVKDALDMKEKNGGGAVEFAFSVSIVKDSSIAVGYKFRIAAASEPRQNDPLAALRARLQIGSPAAPAIEAPKTETEKPAKKSAKPAE